MEVGTRSEVCNNLPAESTSPENGWRLNVVPILDRWIVNAKRQRVGGRGGGGEAQTERLGGTAFSADLGGSSKYSNENFED